MGVVYPSPHDYLPRALELVASGVIPRGQWDRIDTNGPLWNGTHCWMRHRAKGLRYPIISRRGKTENLHRFIYKAIVGPIPEGLTLDHLCRRPYCCNPAHLEPVTSAENSRRAAALKTHCVHGHPLSGDNLLPSAEPGSRRCRQCVIERGRARRAQFKPIGQHASHPLKTHCKRGHPLTDENVFVYASGLRSCRQCRAIARKAWEEREIEKGTIVRVGPKTHCPKGHPLSGDNLYLTPEGWRQCRICRRAANQARDAKRKEKRRMARESKEMRNDRT